MPYRHIHFSSQSSATEFRSTYSACAVFVGILSAIFLVEVGVMFLMPLFLSEHINASLEAIIDATLLAIGSAPALWFMFIRPLRLIGVEKAAVISALAQSANEGMLIFDDSATIRSMNQTAIEFFGVDDQQSSELSLFDLLSGKVRDYVEHSMTFYRTQYGDQRSKGHRAVDSETHHQRAIEAVLDRPGKPPLEIQVSLSFALLRNKPVYLLVLYDISERKQQQRELEKLNQRLVEASHRAGMLEVATGVLHNVGNVLNSINVSSEMIRRKLQNDRSKGLQKAVELMCQNQSQLGKFFTSGQKGEQLLKYLECLVEAIRDDREVSLDEVKVLSDRVEHVKHIVNMQQNYAVSESVTVNLSVAEAIRNALMINDAGLQRHRVNIECDCCDSIYIETDHHKFMQILINLISNAKYAVSASDGEDKQVKIRAEMNEGSLEVTVTDNGVGIANENLTKIFSHGFTTKQDGHGFGLHSCALAAQQMGGRLSAESRGEGHGATFRLVIPTSSPVNALENSICIN
ncbi:MAG: GHKL domain-containing protein [Planctomycetales bacterium]|nr:GHKL domain-containing protein [Planctomycetales bacterium]